ncbi:serine/threonine-protein kinase/endoribonuclease IRE1 [Daphnia magna]|uniref:serine/threonine-protein kinase/endoribonuclease IRE1 n=1 Tax=Daphnia magna TaxID=35525 RepID=UPI001E1BCE21|nr:serine/threonine-protein kinase/endoribonuclease IRE1 [Daphnia magna]
MEIDCGNKVLGRGGYATVFEGVWGVNRRPVAVKRVFLHAEGTRQEEEALRKLDHPNVIKLFHAESGIVLRFFALELCQASLEKLFLKEGDPKKYCGPMPPPLQVLHQLATGLEYIHRMEFIHRDLKPENVLIWVEPRTQKVLMKWSGFGLCEHVDATGSYTITEIKGTLNYLAPEILKMKMLRDTMKRNTLELQKGTVKSDVFGEGLVFGYFLSNGKHPFGRDHAEIQSNIISQNPINLEQIESQSTRELLLKMLTDEPENRISSPDVVKALEQLQN